MSETVLEGSLELQADVFRRGRHAALGEGAFFGGEEEASVGSGERLVTRRLIDAAHVSPLVLFWFWFGLVLVVRFSNCFGVLCGVSGMCCVFVKVFRIAC